MARCSCDSCRQHIEFDDSMVGNEVNCPHCGALTKLLLSNEDQNDEINVGISDKDVPPPPIEGSQLGDIPSRLKELINDKTEGSQLTDIPLRLKELINDKEQIFYSSRPSKNALILTMILSAFVSVVPALLLMVGRLDYFMCVLVFMLPLPLLITYYKWKNTYYVITDSRTIVASGIFNIVIKIVRNDNIQIISINTGIIDRWLKLNSVQLSTAGQGGGSAGILAFIPGLSSGCVTLKQVVTKDIIKYYR